MNIIFEGLNTLQPSQFGFVRSGFLAGTKEGAWPDWRLGPNEEEMVYLAVDDFGPIGFATFYHTEGPERVWLDLLWVDPEHRRKSAGTRLLAAVIAYGERHGLSVEFGTSADNVAMQALVESFGLRPYAINYRKEPVAA
ncbi:MAG: GNAT family N-acetyltransferase [Devosia sp.]|nr:GNAT family N-acetyltransferase [Devosia sp.]